MNFIRKIFTSSVSEEAMSAAKVKAQGIIDKYPVAVFSKSYCPYCTASKNLLKSMGVKEGEKMEILELDKLDDGSAIQSALAEITKQSTVPNIFIGGNHIGGNSDLQAKSGELKAILTEAGAF
ncbi:putative glutaredoxin [Xylariaceae sp. FL1272]|nr:putative glutaredoxin [Xylariaceae sp. FL1272]